MSQNITPSNIKPPHEISQNLVSAIEGALKEEREPKAKRFIKIGISTVVATTLLTLPLALLFREQLGWAWQMAAVVWLFCFMVGFSLYFYPQPRLTVPGYWSPVIFARILIGMTSLTGIQILLCPSFVFLDSSLGWTPFAPITERFMVWGGMKACMFSCGLIFSGLGAIVTFISVRKVLSRSASKDLIRAAGLAFLTQAPVIGVQVVDESLRPFAGYWGVGSALGLLGGAFLIGVGARLSGKGTLKKARPETNHT